MGCFDELPGVSRVKGYDYPGTTWRWLAVNRSGELGLRRGETLTTSRAVVCPEASGGVVLGSGRIDRVILKIPKDPQCSGASIYSGALRGVWVGGKSGSEHEPYPGSGCLGSGFGLWLDMGDQKTLYVQALEEIHVAGEPSGIIATYLGEVITEP